MVGQHAEQQHTLCSVDYELRRSGGQPDEERNRDQRPHAHADGGGDQEPDCITTRWLHSESDAWTFAPSSCRRSRAGRRSVAFPARFSGSHKAQPLCRWPLWLFSFIASGWADDWAGSTPSTLRLIHRGCGAEPPPGAASACQGRRRASTWTGSAESPQPPRPYRSHRWWPIIPPSLNSSASAGVTRRTSAAMSVFGPSRVPWAGSPRSRTPFDVRRAQRLSRSQTGTPSRHADRNQHLLLVS
jgi:hypothetical protein